ncbi:MAG: alkaline phosphatase family protein [Planctomycetota bacterium]
MNPTILLGVDGATFSVLDHMMEGGHMPRLRQLCETGVRGELLSTPHPLTPPAWTTLATGRTPGNHGVFDFIWAEERGSTVYFTLNNYRDIKAETIWTLIGRRGGSVTSLNFPFMSPPPEVVGSLVPGLTSWKHLRRSVYPASLFDELKTLPGFNTKEFAWDFDREARATKLIDDDEHAEWVEFHITREKHWFNIFRYLWKKHPADLTAVLLDGVDKLQHVCWRYLDPNCFHESPTEAQRRARELCLEFFGGLDAFIGEVMDTAPPGARIFLASDHGFGPTEHVFRLNTWLAENGYLTWATTDDLPEDERAKVDKMANRHFVHLDWTRTTAYAQSSATNGIHIRVAREPGQTGIKPEEYDAFREKLISELRAIKVPGTGQPLVRDILKKEEVFPGEHNGRCPDLTLVLFDYGFCSVLDKQPTIWERPEPSGTHQPEGVFLAWGEGIRRGERLPLQQILDMAPTLLYSLGMPIPSDMEGKVMTDAFTEEHLSKTPIETGPPTHADRDDAGTAADVAEEEEDEDVIFERLRALGYVE